MGGGPNDTGGKPYTLEAPKKGDIIFIRRGQDALGIAIVVENQYDPDGYKEDAYIQVLFINKEKKEGYLTERLQGFSGVGKPIMDNFKEHYPETFTVLDKIRQKQHNKGEETTKEEQQGKKEYTLPHLNTILYGPPGTGKTYHTIKMAAEIITGRTIEEYEEARKIFQNELAEEEESRIVFTTFHQNYSYEDFIQGIKPDIDGENLQFERKDGVFKKLVDKARKVELQNYVIIIDEINRANISRVFGELITLVEPDKRLDNKHALTVTLPSGDEFAVPNNLYIIGTMNTADKSIALLDIALRRRFEFRPMYPLQELNGTKMPEDKIHEITVLKTLNEKIRQEKGPDFQIGHSYFMNEDDKKFDLETTMNTKVIPLLLEYYRNDAKKVIELVNSTLKDVKRPFEIPAKDIPDFPLKITEIGK